MEFDKIFQEFWPKVLRLCTGYVNDPEIANDLAQETFIKVWQQLPNFRNESAIGTWIFRIATNHCLRQIQTDRRSLEADLSFPSVEDETDTQEMDRNVRLLYQYISELPEIERIIISLELEDISQAEIARIVGISNANVRVKIHRIKKKLEQKFKDR